MTYLRTTAYGALCALCTAPALAQDAFDLDTITVSGSLTPQELARTGASVEVIDGREAETSDTALTNRLDRLPGVNSTSNGPLGASSSIQLRGLPARYVGVRINGIDMSDPSGTQNQFNFGGLTGASLGRIEVLKGSQSALYGSEAIGGVVDITTWRPDRDGLSGEVRAEAGAFDTRTGALSLGYRGARGEVALSYNRVESDGFSARAGDPEEDGFEQDMLTFTGEFDATDMLTVGGTVIYRDNEADFDPSLAATAGQIQTEELGLRGFARLRTGPVSHELSYAYFDIDRRDTSPGAFTPRFTGERDEISYLGSVEMGGAGTLTGGLEYTEERFAAQPTRGSNDNLAVTAEWLLPATDTLDISLALRHDEDGDFGGKLTGRAAAVWRPAEGWALRAVAGTGFRAPSLFERFSAFGDPTLKPEDSESFEIGVERSFANARIEATLFHITVDDLIDFDPGATACGSGFGCFGQVPGETTSKGLELAGEADINAFLTVFGNYTYTRARNGGQQLTRTPKHDAVIGLDADLTDRLSGSFDVRHVAGVTPSAFAPANNKVGDYTLVGAGLSHAITDSATAYIRIENLFDEDYETAGGFNTAGRSAFVGLRASF
jgi:vitamin B12 transporter